MRLLWAALVALGLGAAAYAAWGGWPGDGDPPPCPHSSAPNGGAGGHDPARPAH